MNTKLKISVVLAAAAICGLATISNSSLSLRAEFNEEDDAKLLWLSEIKAYDVEEGESTLYSLETIENDSKGRILHDYYDSIDEDGIRTKETLSTYTWDDNGNMTKNVTSLYDEETQQYVDCRIYDYVFDADNHLTEKKITNCDEGEPFVYSKNTFTYTNGLLTEEREYSKNETLEYITEHTYDTDNNLTKSEVFFALDGEENKYLWTQYLYEYSNGDCVKYTWESFQQNGNTVAFHEYDYTYNESHQKTETVHTEHKLYDRNTISSVTRNTYSYNGDEVTRIDATKDLNSGAWTNTRKVVSVDTDSVYSTVDYSADGEGWEFEYASKDVKIFENGRQARIEYLSKDSEESDYVLNSYIEYTYNVPSGISVGAIIAIVVGSLAVIYVAGYVLWTKTVFSFLSKPFFGKLYGGFDKGVKTSTNFIKNKLSKKTAESK